jgi:hypothetical protein
MSQLIMNQITVRSIKVNEIIWFSTWTVELRIILKKQTNITSKSQVHDIDNVMRHEQIKQIIDKRPFSVIELEN